MGWILISALANRGGLNMGGIGWCTDFCKRHLAGRCGHVYHLVPGSHGGGGRGRAETHPERSRVGCSRPVPCAQKSLVLVMLCSHRLGILYNLIITKLNVESVGRMCVYQEVK